MRDAMTHAHPVAVLALVLMVAGCGSGTNPPTAPGPSSGGGIPHPASKPFLDQEKDIPAQLEWNREIVSQRGGTFSFRVTSQGPFAVTVVTDKGLRAAKAGDRKAFDNRDLLLTVDSRGTSFESKVTVPAGTSWFIIENQTNNTVKMHLQCWE
jgi:hypothetical protein